MPKGELSLDQSAIDVIMKARGINFCATSTKCAIAAQLNIAPSLAQAIISLNDDYRPWLPFEETKPGKRWSHVRCWVISKIQK